MFHIPRLDQMLKIPAALNHFLRFFRNKLKINKSIMSENCFQEPSFDILSKFEEKMSLISDWAWTRKSESKVMVHSCSRYTVFLTKRGKTSRRMFKFIKEKLSDEKIKWIFVKISRGTAEDDFRVKTCDILTVMFQIFVTEFSNSFRIQKYHFCKPMPTITKT